MNSFAYSLLTRSPIPGPVQAKLAADPNRARLLAGNPYLHPDAFPVVYPAGTSQKLAADIIGTCRDPRIVDYALHTLGERRRNVLSAVVNTWVISASHQQAMVGRRISGGASELLLGDGVIAEMAPTLGHDARVDACVDWAVKAAHDGADAQLCWQAALGGRDRNDSQPAWSSIAELCALHPQLAAAAAASSTPMLVVAASAGELSEPDQRTLVAHARSGLERFDNQAPNLKMPTWQAFAIVANLLDAPGTVEAVRHQAFEVVDSAGWSDQLTLRGIPGAHTWWSAGTRLGDITDLGVLERLCDRASNPAYPLAGRRWQWMTLARSTNIDRAVALRLMGHLSQAPTTAWTPIGALAARFGIEPAWAMANQGHFGALSNLSRSATRRQENQLPAGEPARRRHPAWDDHADVQATSVPVQDGTITAKELVNAGLYLSETLGDDIARWETILELGSSFDGPLSQLAELTAKLT